MGDNNPIDSHEGEMGRSPMPHPRCIYLFLIFVVALVPGSVTPARQPTQLEMSIAVIHVDGTGLQQLIARPQWLYGSPSFSGDMKRILLDGWPAGRQLHETAIFTANVDGSGLTKICEGAMPQWSPDERTIAFHKYNVGVVLVNADGTGREVMLPEGGSPAWSPDGHQLAVLRWGDEIQIIDLRTGKRRRLNEVDPIHPVPGFSWSPDGSEICLVGWPDPTNRQPRAMAIASTSHPKQALRYLESGLIDSRVSWSPDGSTIAFSRAVAAAAPQQLYLLSTKPGATARRVPGQPATRSNFDPSWSADGKQLLFASFQLDAAIPVENELFSTQLESSVRLIGCELIARGPRAAARFSGQ